MFLPAICWMFILACNVVVIEADECSIGGFDLTRFQSFNPWRIGHNKTEISFEINICNESIGCSDGISVKGVNRSSNAVTSYGNCSILQQSDERDDEELLVMIRGSPCPEMPGEQLMTVIYFKCGKTLGKPEYLGTMGCSAHFEWESYEFCKGVEHPDNEIPCYVYNSSQVIDLSPLTKLTGGYLVDDKNNGRDYYINVCRDIKPDSATGTGLCPKGAGSCRIFEGRGSNFGRPGTKLKVVGPEIQMHYTVTNETPVGCTGPPETVVFFRCPERGGSKQPELLTDYDCTVEIEWWTEYACPQQTLTSETCQLTMESHNIDIDLSPLSKASGLPYHVVEHKPNGDTYDYYLNVCGELGIACGADDSLTEAVCQVKRVPDGSDGALEKGKKMGSPHHQLLRYSDGVLTLTYKNGEACHTNFRRTTIINFQCNRTAGTGSPELREETNCTYVFDWPTRYACENHPLETACHVEHGGKLFDLSDLTLTRDHNWLALADQEADRGTQYFINVCHDVLSVGEATGCPAGAAVCKKESDKSVSLGSFTKSLQYDPVTQKIYMNYTVAPSSNQEGHECRGAGNSIVTFICKPGDLESGPVLVSKSSDACVYHFEWYTAAACPMSHVRGTNCHVVDTQAGYSFDLSSLRKESGDGYKVSDGQYDFYINVCGKIGGDHCQDKNAAVCQVKKDGSGEFNTGSPSQTLEYFNGVLNLTYTDGDPYHNEQNTPRKTEIAFVCDMQAGAGRPEFLVEKDQIYSFKWLTAYACPTVPIECVARDDDGKQYDLSSLSKAGIGENWMVLDDSDPSDRRIFYINVCRPLTPIEGLASSRTCDLSAAVCEISVKGQEETVDKSNLGQAKTGPKVKTGRDSYLSLEYTEGEP